MSDMRLQGSVVGRQLVGDLHAAGRCDSAIALARAARFFT